MVCAAIVAVLVAIQWTCLLCFAEKSLASITGGDFSKATVHRVKLYAYVATAAGIIAIGILIYCGHPVLIRLMHD